MTGLSYPSFVITLVGQTEIYENFKGLVEEMVAKMKEAKVDLLEAVKTHCVIFLSNPRYNFSLQTITLENIFVYLVTCFFTFRGLVDQTCLAPLLVTH